MRNFGILLQLTLKYKNLVWGCPKIGYFVTFFYKIVQHKYNILKLIYKTVNSFLLRSC